MNTSQLSQDDLSQTIAPLDIVGDVEIVVGDPSAISEQTCKLCDRFVLIPGLDGYLCKYCGWVEGRSVAELAALKQGKKGKR